MSKENCYSAQCAWLFGHAHLIGESSVAFDNRAKIHTLSFALEDGFSFGFTVFAAVSFFALVDFFFAVFSVFAVFARRDAAFALASDLRCCFARSVRRSSS